MTQLGGSLSNRPALSYEYVAKALNGKAKRSILCPVCGPDHDNRKTTMGAIAGLGRKKELIHCYCGRCGLKELLMPGKSSSYRPPLQPEHDWDKQLALVQELWRGTDSIIEVPVAAMYLRGRGLTGVRGFSLRAVRYVRHRTGVCYAAIVAAVSDPDGVITNLQYCYLDNQGRKIDAQPQRAFVTGAKLPRGGAVRLGEPQDGRLGIAEGVETAMAAAALYRVPVWASTGAGMLEKFQPPGHVKKMLVFGDNDSHGQGQKSADILARRLQSEGRLAKVFIPPYVGDWNDVLLKGDGHGIATEIP